MATSFDIIIDMALTSISDYALANLYNLDIDKFNTKMDSYLLRSIPRFPECRQSLDYSLSEREFESDLNIYEINIIADWLIYVWYESKAQDVLDFREVLQDKDFKKYSTGQNLNARESHLSNLYVKIKQQITDYNLLYISEVNLIGGN